MRHHLDGSRTCLKGTVSIVRFAGLAILLLLLVQTAQAQTYQPAAQEKQEILERHALNQESR
ncbi:MAG TPA: hypothetical protein PLZ01_08755 [bacterium]|nr:hypothetical protein [bacterium]